tara:strand:+ start:251 stop:484 length:234 start_codon:yes stop_codon:yes gene_type:complete
MQMIWDTEISVARMPIQRFQRNILIGLHLKASVARMATHHLAFVHPVDMPCSQVDTIGVTFTALLDLSETLFSNQIN